MSKTGNNKLTFLVIFKLTFLVKIILTILRDLDGIRTDLSFMLILLKFALFWQGGFFMGGLRMTGAHKRKSSKKI